MSDSGRKPPSLELPSANAGANGHPVKPQTLGARFEDFETHDLPSASPSRISSDKQQEQTASPISDLGSSAVSPSRKCLVRAFFTVRFLVKLVSVGLMGGVLIIAALNWPPWVVEDEAARTQIMSTLFACGLFLVAVEDILGVNKSAVMLLLAASMWTLLAVGYHPNSSEYGANKLHHELNKGLQEVGSVILFLLPAMGVVESIDHFDGFAIVTHIIRKGMAGNQERIMPIICILTFLLSSIIDNLTATIVALKILHHVAADEDWRKMCGGLTVIAANAGGAWSPIGDVTTTMLWIQGKITAPKTVSWLLLPSMVAGFLPLSGVYWWKMRALRSSYPRKEQWHRRSKPGESDDVDSHAEQDQEQEPLRLADEDGELTGQVTPFKVATLALGIVCILMVPALKMWTGLPPYLGMLLALGLVWLITDALAHGETAIPITASDGQSPMEGIMRGHDTGPTKRGVVQALHKLDLTGLLFFTGVLLAVESLDSAGILRNYATFLVDACGHSPVVLCTFLGLSSAVVDNVPLVEAAVNMFSHVPADDPLWQLVAFAAGTGGSILSIGSIAGVTLMSMEGVGFIWYCKHISIWAVIGFFLGIATYQLQRSLLL